MASGNHSSAVETTQVPGDALMLNSNNDGQGQINMQASTEIANSLVQHDLSVTVDALMLSGGEREATTSVDALMLSAGGGSSKDDGSNMHTEVANSPLPVAVDSLTLPAGGDGRLKNDGGEADGSGSGSGSGSNNGTAVVGKCIGRWNHGTSWTTVLDQGGRRHMEDKLVAIPIFMSLPCDQFGGCTSPNCAYAAKDSRVHYFAVFDGHGGSQVSAYCASTLHETLAEEWKSESGVDEWGPRWEIALSRAYEKVDEACMDKSLASAGSTALVVLVSPCQIIATNCGDSRAVLVRKTETIPLTKDHKPNRIDEVQRIVRGGGCILNVHGVLRVDGILAMTRAIGDQSLKPWVTSDPEVTFTTRSEEDECLILASDGLWDVMSSDEVGSLARKLIRQKRRELISGERSSISVANLIHEEARARSSSDNVAVIAIDLKPPRKRRQLRPA